MIAQIKEGFMVDVKQLTVDVIRCPRITLDELRSHAGKANHVASLVHSPGGRSWIRFGRPYLSLGRRMRQWVTFGLSRLGLRCCGPLCFLTRRMGLFTASGVMTSIAIAVSRL